jgi:exosortase family protein XrtG
VSWGYNEGDDQLHWLIESNKTQGAASYALNLDMNDDGDFSGPRDRIITLTLADELLADTVEVKVARADAGESAVSDSGKGLVRTFSENIVMLEASIGGNEIGFVPGSVYRMYVVSDIGERVPETGDVQIFRGLGKRANAYAAFPRASSVTRWVALAALVGVWAAVTLFFRAYRIWVMYYVVGAVGLAVLVILAGQAAQVDGIMGAGVAVSASAISNLFGIPAKLFPGEPGAIMVFVVGQIVGNDHGWTIVRLTVESSSLLESAVLIGSVAFYPASTPSQRFRIALASVLAVYAANIVRLVIVIVVLHFWGKESLFVAHTVIGRAVFFVLVIGIFWYALTLPTIRRVSQKLRQELAA